MYKYLIFAILVVGISAVPQRKPKTKNASCANESVLENCLQQLFMMSGGEKQFPNSTEQVTQFCGKLKEIDTCIKGYTRKCMTPTGRRATEVAIAGVARMVKRMCKSPAKIQEFVKHSKCGNAIKGDMKSCVGEYKTALRGAIKANPSEKLGIICCKFYDWRGCVRKGFDRVGDELCPNDSRTYYANVADSFQSDVFDLICSQYDEGSAKCAAVTVPAAPSSTQSMSLISALRENIKSILAADQQQQ